ncbi:hypothetical protein AB0C12_35215 [Actinoplanes sp. NPDC048967]|uniref:hypothetical protein n=1 Tax=Actinoplanes sp. NPDC048967 TaxID=3155269 RepID=UPI0033E6B2F5
MSAILVAALFAVLACVSSLVWYTVSQLKGRNGRSKIAFAAGKIQLSVEFEVENHAPRTDDPEVVNVIDVSHQAPPSTAIAAVKDEGGDGR